MAHIEVWGVQRKRLASPSQHCHFDIGWERYQNAPVFNLLFPFDQKKNLLFPGDICFFKQN